MKNRKIPTRNYLIVIVIILVTILLALSISNYFRKKIEYQNQTNITSYLSEIKVEELDNFLTENHDVMIYLVDSNNSTKLQNKVKKIILNYNYNKDMVVLNTSSDSESIFNLLKEKYSNPNQNSKYRTNSILIIKEGKIVAVFEINDDNVKNMRTFIDTNFYGVK